MSTNKRKKPAHSGRASATARTTGDPKPNAPNKRPRPAQPEARKEKRRAAKPRRRGRAEVRVSSTAAPLRPFADLTQRTSQSPAGLLTEPEAENEASETDFANSETAMLGLGSRMIAPDVAYEPDLGPPSSILPPPLRASAGPLELEAQIRALEARLDGLIRRATPPSDPPPSPSEEAEPDTADKLERVAAERVEPAAIGPSGYLERQWGRDALRSRIEEVDDFGLDPELEAKLRPGIDLLYRRYFRVEVENIENVPSTGRAVIVANHGGTLPLDGAMLRTAMRLDHPSRRDLRWLAEDFVFYLPFAGVFLNRIGAVRACPENAERLLEKEGLIAVFPEGAHGVKKLFRDRYQLQRFGRGGYIRLCLRMRAPLIPCAIIGAEEANPLLYRFESLAALWKLPYLPITPTFPLLGPLGLLPAPTRWKLRFGEPISFDAYGPEALEDHLLVGRLSERVRSAIQGLLDSGLSQRKSVWFG